MTAAPTTWVNFYDILNLPETADADRVREAIRQQRRLWNKRAGQADPTQKQLAERRISELAEAERISVENKLDDSEAILAELKRSKHWPPS